MQGTAGWTAKRQSSRQRGLWTLREAYATLVHLEGMWQTRVDDPTIDVRVRWRRCGLPCPGGRVSQTLPGRPRAEPPVLPPWESAAHREPCRVLGGGVRGSGALL